MSDARTQALIKMGAGRFGSVSTPGWMQVLASMSPIGQRPFVMDMRQGVVALAGRGAGKSYATAARFHRLAAAHPHANSVFIAYSAERARDILTPSLRDLDTRYKIGLTERLGERAVEWPNGYKVQFRGLKDANEANKRRGTPWVSAAWDECASFAQNLFEYDLRECVEPRLVDYNGKWWATGTPGPVPTGFWYELSSGNDPSVPLYHWTALTNPHIPNVLKYYTDVLQRMQGVPDRSKWPAHARTIMDLITDETCWKILPASFVREYLGRWILDLKALIYRITPKNSYAEFPIRPDYWTIGIDLGGHSEEQPDLDHAAVSVCASHSSLPFIWCPESRKLSDVTVDSLAAYVCQLLTKYPEASAHIDSTSAGKLIENTLKKMGIPIQCADKAKKLRRIQLVQSAIRSGNLQLHIRECMDLRNEATALVWNDKRDDHSPKCDDDAWDSLLYAATPHMGDYRPEENPVVPGSKEWQHAQEMAEYEQALQNAIEQYGDAEDRLWLPIAA